VKNLFILLFIFFLITGSRVDYCVQISKNLDENWERYWRKGGGQPLSTLTILSPYRYYVFQLGISIGYSVGW